MIETEALTTDADADAVPVACPPASSAALTVTVSLAVPTAPGALYEPVHVVEAPAVRTVTPHVKGPAMLSVTDEMCSSPTVIVFATVAVTAIVPPTSTTGVTALVTETEACSTVSVTWELAVAIPEAVSVATTVIVSVAGPGAPGAVYEAVQVVEAPAARVVERQLYVAAALSLIVKVSVPEGAVFCTVAVMAIVPPTST